MISTKQIATLLLLIATALPDALGAEDKSGPKSIPELQAAIERVLKETKTPGAAIAIVSRDKAEWVAGIGKADVAANKPVTAETLFRIGSTSKAFAALAALQLQEEGKLKLTDTVQPMGARSGLFQSMGGNRPGAPGPPDGTHHGF